MTAVLMLLRQVTESVEEVAAAAFGSGECLLPKAARVRQIDIHTQALRNYADWKDMNFN